MGPNTQPTHEDKAEVVLISGFLGSGKTTLLKRILSWEDDLAGTVVLVNEFGEVGIDGALLSGSGSDVVELASGCICCSLAADLRQSLLGIVEQFKPSRILIEASGVADPISIRETVCADDLSAKLTLKKIVTVLDADLWEGRHIFGPLFFHQLELANLILLNKVDLFDKQRIPQFLKEIHDLMPGTQVVPTIRCNVDPEALAVDSTSLNIDLKPMRFFQQYTAETARPANAEGSSPDHPEGEENACMQGVDASGFATFSFQSAEPMDEKRFTAFLGSLPWELFRVKGSVRLQDRSAFVNFVGGKYECSPLDESADTLLAFIGWDIDVDAILSQLNTCLASHS